MKNGTTKQEKQIQIVRDSYDMRHKFGFGFKDVFINRAEKTVKIELFLIEEDHFEAKGQEADSLIEAVDKLRDETKVAERSCLIHILKERGVFENMTPVFPQKKTDAVSVTHID